MGKSMTVAYLLSQREQLVDAMDEYDRAASNLPLDGQHRCLCIRDLVHEIRRRRDLSLLLALDEEFEPFEPYLAIELYVHPSEIIQAVLPTELQPGAYNEFRQLLRYLLRVVNGAIHRTFRALTSLATFSSTLLRECPWHLLHGTHPPEDSSAFTFMKARGFATA
jgi:hypothetical protein